jgi:hypothetical protein
MNLKVDVSTIISFLKDDIFGLIILGVITSILSTIIYELCKKQWIRFVVFIKRKLHISRLKKDSKDYSDGYTAGYANKSSYH